MKMFCKVPFSKVVEEAGLNRAARWMPLAWAFLLLGLIVAVLSGYTSTSSLDPLHSDSSFLRILFFSIDVVSFFAGLELLGSLIDLLLAWLRLGRQK